MGTNRPDNNKSQETRQQIKDREDREALEQLRQQKLTEDLRKLMATEEFRNVASEILGMGKIFQTAMTGNSHTFHITGRQDFAKEILLFFMRGGPEQAFDLLKRQQVKPE